jgi:hypothetical protein
VIAFRGEWVIGYAENPQVEFRSPLVAILGGGTESSVPFGGKSLIRLGRKMEKTKGSRQAVPFVLVKRSRVKSGKYPSVPVFIVAIHRILHGDDPQPQHARGRPPELNRRRANYEIRGGGAWRVLKVWSHNHGRD